MLNGGPEDPASTFLLQPKACLMSCALTSPSCRKPSLQSLSLWTAVHSQLHCHHTTSVSVKLVSHFYFTRGRVHKTVKRGHQLQFLQPEKHKLTTTCWQRVWQSCSLLSISNVLLGSEVLVIFLFLFLGIQILHTV